jgi:glutathione synthase/RimK-type ligase-like ATP-grasp enzyme
VREYLTDPSWIERRRLRVVNLCRDIHYHSAGYYASLLAEARGHRVVPTVRTIQDLSRRTFYLGDVDPLGPEAQRALTDRAGDAVPDRLERHFVFGASQDPALKSLARSLFETFPAPILRVEFRSPGDEWRVHSVRIAGLARIGPEMEPFFAEALSRHLGRRWRHPRTRAPGRFELAILHDPDESLPPSDRPALAAFVRAARAEGLGAELITRRDYGRLAEFDALFIRETTGVNHHTYRFAHRAASEGLVVIDDPDSILRCTNKIFLAELLQRAHVPTPRSVIVARDDLDVAGETLGFPLVLKVPDGAFGLGVFKVEDRVQLEARAAGLFQRSQLLLAQAWTYTPFDWRIGVLDREPLFACRYHMSRGHWQILHHDAPEADREGDSDTLPLEAVPSAVLETATRAARLVGRGLYGVDLKETPDGVKVIEVNDNPNIDAGIEDAVLGTELYRRIIRTFVQRLEARAARAPGDGRGDGR